MIDAHARRGPATGPVLVLGGSGAVGRELARVLTDDAVDVICASRRPPTGLPTAARWRRLDALNPGALDDAVRAAAVVVDASGLDDPRIATAVLAAGRDLVDLSADTAHLAALDALDETARTHRTTVLAGVGLAPGLTNLLALDTHARAPDADAIDLDLVLGLGEHHGPQATAWLLAQLATPARHHPHRVTLPGGFGRRTLHWVDFAEQHTLTRDLGVPVISRIGLDPPVLGAFTVAAARVPGAHRLLLATAGAASRLTQRDWWTAAARAADGTTTWATGERQNTATALVAAIAVHRLLDHDPPLGTHHLHHVVDLASVALTLNSNGIAISRSGTATASPPADREQATPRR